MSLAFPAYRDMAAAWFAFMGIDRDTPPSYSTPSEFARAPADEAWVYSCVRRLYQSGAGVPLRVYLKHGKELVPVADEPSSEGDDLQALLDYANPVDMTGSELKAYTIASGAVWGESYWRKVRGRLGGPPQEVYWLRAPDVDPKAPDGRRVLTYNYRPKKGGLEEYRPQDIIAFKTPNLVDPLHGLSPLSAIGNDIATGRLWAQHRASTIANDSIPPGYWQIPKDAEFTKQDESLVRRALRALRGPRNRGRVPIMPTGLKFEGISLSPHDAEMVAAGKLSRMAVCAALGVPLVLAGDDEKTSVYANLRDAERVFWRGTMVPLLDSYADTLNNWLTPEFDPSRTRLVVAFDYGEIEALKPTLDVEWNMWLAGIYSQAVVPNEFRRHFRLGPDVSWGDRPVPRTAIAIRPDPASLNADALPTLDPMTEAALPEPSTIEADASSAAGTLRSYGKAFYRLQPVKTWVAHPYDPLDTVALFAGRSVSTRTRMQIEAGLRRRDSAETIAAALEEQP